MNNRRRSIIGLNKLILPSGFKQVEYVQSTGYANLITQINPVGTTYVESVSSSSTYNPPVVVANVAPRTIGFNPSSNNYVLGLGTFKIDKKLQVSAKIAQDGESPVNYTAISDYEFELNKKYSTTVKITEHGLYLYIDDRLIEFVSGNYQIADNADNRNQRYGLMCTCQDSYYIFGQLAGRFYSGMILKQNETHIFVPIVTTEDKTGYYNTSAVSAPTGTAGIYDWNSDILYVPRNVNQLTAGPDV